MRWQPVAVVGGAAAGRASGAEPGASVGPRDNTAELYALLERLPIALIVDDPMPCVNPLYCFRHQVSRNPPRQQGPTERSDAPS